MEKIGQVGFHILDTVLRDEPWQDFGFPRRPKYGAVVQRLRPAQSVQLEKRLLQEMIVLQCAAYIRANVLSESDLSVLIDLLVDGSDESLGLWQCYGLDSPGGAKEHLLRGVYEYLAESEGKWTMILMSRLRLTELQDAKLVARLTLGCIQFVDTIHAMIHLLKHGHVT